MLQNEKILLLGASGFLGTYIQRYATKTILSPSRSILNLLDETAIYSYIDENQPSAILYAAGLTNIDEAEKNPELAEKLNHKTPQNILHMTPHIPFFYISTDAVFDGYAEKDSFTENDSPRPKSIYGKTKLRGEQAVLDKSNHNAVIRLITLFGRNERKPNFVEKMITMLKENKPFIGIEDQLQNPLLISVAAKGVNFIVNNKHSGIYHLGSLDYDTNYNFLLRIVHKYNLDSSLLQKISFNTFMKERAFSRKQNSVLLTTKFNTISEQKILQKLDESINELYELMK